MDPSRLDRIARLFATRTTRRIALAGGGAGLASMALAPAASAVQGDAATPAPFPADPHPSADEADGPEMLFVQPFNGGTWLPAEGGDGLFTLTLTGASAQTVYFSDRPDRIFGLAPMQQFLDGLGFTPVDPPNAALVADADDGGQQILVIELFNPAYDDAAETLTYDARVLADYHGFGLTHVATQQTDYELPNAFGRGGLFIDDCRDQPYDCYSGGVGSPSTLVGQTRVPYYYDYSCHCCKAPSSGDQYCQKAFPDQCPESFSCVARKHI